MYACDNCGASLRFDISSYRMACDHCGSAFDMEKVEDGSYRGREYETNVFRCSQCGGEIFTESNDLTGYCSYCGTPQVFEQRVAKIRRPGWIIPFREDAESCKRKYRQAAKRAWFAPKEIRNAEMVDSVRGVYLPYWFYESDFDRGMSVQGTANDKMKITKTQVIHTKERVTAHFRGQYLALQEDASSWYWDEISDSMMPYQLTQVTKGLQKFNPAFLCGFYGETADVEMPDSKKKREYEADSVKRANYWIYESFKKSHSMYTGVEHFRKPTESQFVLGLLPVWFLAFRRGNRVSYSTVNGQTGQMSVEFPVDLRKFLACTFGLAAILFLLLNLFWVMRPEYVALAAAIGAGWAVHLSCRDLNEIGRKAVDILPPDRHRNAVKPRRDIYEHKYWKIETAPYLLILLLIWAENAGHIERYPHGLMAHLPVIFTFWVLGWATWDMVNYMKHTRFAVRYGGFSLEGNYPAYLSILVALVVQILRPVSDAVYYAVGFGCMGACLASMLMVVMMYNRMVSRPMPQFEHKGGVDFGENG